MDGVVVLGEVLRRVEILERADGRRLNLRLKVLLLLPGGRDEVLRRLQRDERRLLRLRVHLPNNTKISHCYTTFC